MARPPIRYRDIIAIGASAGGTQTLSELVGGLPAELPATLLVAQHTAPAAPPVLPRILSRAGRLRATLAADDETIERGHIYTAPPDHHLLVGEGHLVVTRGPRENGHRPAVDPLFRSAARHYGRRVIAVVLSGTLDDGTAGLVTVKSRGGIAIAQDPDDALHPGMPRSAIEGDHPDYVVRISELADLLCKLVQEPLAPGVVNGRSGRKPSREDSSTAASSELRAEGAIPASVTCPECNGPLFERQEGDVTTFECLVGHRYSQASLDQEQARQLETVLWNAVRGLHERAELVRRLARDRNRDRVAEMYLDRASAFEQQADAIVTAIRHLGSQAEQLTEVNQ